MAINKATIITNAKASILSAISTANDDDGSLTAMVTAITDAIIDEIVSNGQVTIPITTVSTGTMQLP